MLLALTFVAALAQSSAPSLPISNAFLNDFENWTWTGPYYAANAAAGTPPLEGVITWKRIDATQIGSDQCMLC